MEAERIWNQAGDDKKSFISILRFADYVMLLTSSLSKLKRMMTDFKRSTEKKGLKIHRDKTRILISHGSNKRREIEFDKIRVEILSPERKS